MQPTENLPSHLSDLFWEKGHLFSKVIQGKEKAGAKFADYFDTNQSISLISPHHALLLLRGRREGILRLSFKLLPPNEIPELSNATKQEKNQLDKALFQRLRIVAEKKAIALCIQNFQERLVTTAPVENKVILSFDTQQRAGVKVAIIDTAGHFLDATHIHMYPPLKNWYGSIAELAKFVIKYHVELIVIGSGSAFREISRLVSALIQMYPDLKLKKQTSQTTGTPPYPAEASDKSGDESTWTAVCIARQVRNPLEALLNMDPATINVSPYQQDVRPEILKPALEIAIKEHIENIKQGNTKSRAPQHSQKKFSPTKQPSEKPLFNSAMADALAKLRVQS